MADIHSEMAEIDSVSPAGAHRVEFVRPTGFPGNFSIFLDFFVDFFFFFFGFFQFLDW